MIYSFPNPERIPRSLFAEFVSITWIEMVNAQDMTVNFIEKRSRKILIVNIAGPVPRLENA